MPDSFLFLHLDESHETSSHTSVTTIHSTISFQRVFFIPRGQSKETEMQFGRKSGESLNSEVDLCSGFSAGQM